MTTAIEDILAKTEDETHRRVVTVEILVDQELHAEHAELDAELEHLAESGTESIGTPRAREIAARLVEIEQETRDRRVSFRFRALSRKQWMDLLAAHPPTKKQLDEDARLRGMRAGLDFNPATFPVAVIAACCVDPEMTVDDAKRLEDSLHFVQFETLWGAALECNTGGMAAPKSLAAGLILQRSG